MFAASQHRVCDTNDFMQNIAHQSSEKLVNRLIELKYEQHVQSAGKDGPVSVHTVTDPYCFDVPGSLFINGCRIISLGTETVSSAASADSCHIVFPYMLSGLPVFYNLGRFIECGNGLFITRYHTSLANIIRLPYVVPGKTPEKIVSDGRSWGRQYEVFLHASECASVSHSIMRQLREYPSIWAMYSLCRLKVLVESTGLVEDASAGTRARCGSGYAAGNGSAGVGGAGGAAGPAWTAACERDDLCVDASANKAELGTLLRRCSEFVKNHANKSIALSMILHDMAAACVVVSMYKTGHYVVCPSRRDAAAGFIKEYVHSGFVHEAGSISDTIYVVTRACSTSTRCVSDSDLFSYTLASNEDMLLKMDYINAKFAELGAEAQKRRAGPGTAEAVSTERAAGLPAAPGPAEDVLEFSMDMQDGLGDDIMDILAGVGDTENTHGGGFPKPAQTSDRNGAGAATAERRRPIDKVGAEKPQTAPAGTSSDAQKQRSAAAETAASDRQDVDAATKKSIAKRSKTDQKQEQKPDSKQNGAKKTKLV